MSCIITYKGKQYSEQQFKEYFINNKNEFATSIAKNKDVIDSFKRKMEAIQEVFNANPELSKIGDVFSYAIYLNTIFPDSKVKDIVYHGTSDKFEGNFLPKEKEAIFFKEDLKEAKQYAEIAYADKYFPDDEGAFLDKNKVGGKGFVIAAIINTINPEITDEGADHVPKNRKKYDGFNNGEEIGVFKSEQIHILGSKSDIEGFKQFVKSPTISKEVEQPTVKVEVVSRYSNVDVKANPDKIYVFGDNTQRVGTGGQAQIRNNPNAFGIATKLKPNNNPDAFMTDEDLESNKQVIDSDIAKIKAQNKPLVFPKDGFGTGLAKLKEKAPQTYEYLKQRLLEEFGFNNDTGELSQTPSKEVENKTEDWTQENNDCGI